MSLNKKEKDELMYGEIFARYLETRHDLKYRVVLTKQSIITPPHSYADVDVILEPLSDSQPLFLQLRFDVKPEGVIWKDPKTKKDTILFSGGEVTLSIEEKESHYLRQQRDISNIILLIQGDLSADEAKSFIDVSKHQSSGFREIYYVSPKTSIVGRTDGWDEFVIPIKNLNRFSN